MGEKLLGRRGGLYRSGVELGECSCLAPYLSTTCPEGEGDTIGLRAVCNVPRERPNLRALNRPPARPHPLGPPFGQNMRCDLSTTVTYPNWE